MLLDASGNLGLGVTPSAWWSTFKVIDINTTGAIASSGNDVQILTNTFFNGTSFIYKQTQGAARFRINEGQFVWQQAPSGTAGNAITFTQAMTLFSSGNLSIGNTSDNNFRLDVSGNVRIANTLRIDGYDSASGQRAIGFGGNTLGTNPVIYSNGAYLAINSKTSEILYLNESVNSTIALATGGGNVGIGTLSTVGRLTIQQSINDTTGGISIFSLDGNGAIISRVNDGGLTFRNGGFERIRITSDGDVRINHTANFSATFSVKKVTGRTIVNFSNETDADLQITTSDSGAATKFATISPSVSGQQLRIGVNNNNVLIGTTTDSGYRLSVEGSGDSPLRLRNASATGGRFWKVGPDAGSNFIIYNENNNGAYINWTATSWTSNSDSRLKNIIRGIDNATESLLTLNPVIFSWKTDETNKENVGLIAQDVEKVFPQLIDQNSEGMLGVRYTELIPVLVASIQEQQTLIQSLTDRLSALENK
jgi:hypothetical protein